MSAPSFGLLARRRFLPLFATQFLGAFNDNLYRSAMLFLVSFSLYRGDADKAAMIAVIAGGVFILPYFLFSSLAGQLADASDKSRVAQGVKLAEVAIMALGAGAIAAGSMPLLFLTLFLMGTHSTIFGPVKYAILPQHLNGPELMGGTGLIEAGTFLAILSGQLAGGLIPAGHATALMLGVAGLGLVSSLFIPSAKPEGVPPRIDLNLARASVRIVREAGRTRSLMLVIGGISWFFALGAVLTQQFVPLVGHLNATAEVGALFLGLFSVGVAVGSMLVGRWLKGELSARYVPAAALAMALATIDLGLTVAGLRPWATTAGVREFVREPGSWHLIADLLAIAVAGGVFIVPLYALLQTLGDPATRSRDVAANNIVNAAAMVVISGLVAALLATGAGSATLFVVLGVVGLAVALAACVLLPETVFKGLIRGLLRLFYRVELVGAENMPAAGTRAVVVVNHVSFLDGLLLGAFLPGKPTFAVHTRIAQAWWIKPFLKLFDAFPVDPTNPMSAKAMVKAVREGRTLVIFPEGRITVTGALMKVFDGPGMVADKADAPIVPVRIDGAQFSPFSRLKGKVRTRWFPKVRLTVLPPRRFAIDGEMSARARRAIAGRRLYDEMSAMMFATSDTGRTLFAALADAAALHGRDAKVVEDVKRQPLTYGRLLAGSIALGRVLARESRAGEAVGVLLPNVSGVVATFFALQAEGRVPAMLNYTAGLANIDAACRAAEVETIITARAFVEQAKLGDLIDALGATRRILFLEDLAPRIGAWAKLRALIASRRARGPAVSPDAPAVILFTSGSEGLPKGVALSHRNLLSNCQQLAARIDFSPTDIVLNALPVFHSFGLTGGTLLPVLNGIRTLLYPSPLHYRIVPALAYDANATILFGTDTFLAGYARMASPYDFYSIRYIFAGAEKVRDTTRATYAERFGLRIMEGYGATEAGPVIAVNTPMHFRAGSVGRLLPAIEARLEPVPGIDDEGGTVGRLAIRGPNVMAGYYKADAPGLLQPPAGGWHDSGDIVQIDAEGFVTIRGRAKRFAKIGGEMVSLPAVEGYAAAVWPGFDHAVVTRPDPRKGEQLVLFTTAPGADAKALLAWGKANGIAELALPRDVRPVPALPVLGTGKIDYVTLGQMAAAGTTAPVEADEEEAA
ncbi:acyl-[ACP]--phospholipid O-acyltransferase [Sphingomonas jatrophae]|uniref:Acyl-[acyl-carrier-protein]-phospholipid O-acyltransferase / long-chain-fatty-acid--[acyl-carrier-protein] ligase n=1 Tax=Sphingomonas jatrophae TaxID=1166337 RepID=A0A1I6JC09_9SPHN|nr:acyl-[ACP]--phospholipid O-acyltransferase [Sphingomonas jatrophae]SFR76471.1 acyl-[acyl-carrier-protein]-phospholipid O-acyltransferase / long-chain-fatty-acid--[acyl-carrier-protein] ligase [Sphingomonas jatrophae]